MDGNYLPKPILSIIFNRKWCKSTVNVSSATASERGKNRKRKEQKKSLFAIKFNLLKLLLVSFVSKGQSDWVSAD
jgi:hypothetical protein